MGFFPIRDILKLLAVSRYVVSRKQCLCLANRS